MKKASSTLFIAEISSNHQRSLERCVAFVDTAGEIGCDVVKFQLFKVDELFVPEVVSQFEHLQKRREWELPLAFIPEIAARCRARGLQFSCTPFYLRAVEELYPYVDFYKIASYELMWGDLLRECASTGKPVVLSTGMATLLEVRTAVEILKNAGCRELSLLHCVSSYPVPIKDCNLAAIERMEREFQCPVGWSDHSVSPAVIYRAVYRWGASLVEFHLDLDGTGEEFGTGHCWLPEQMASVIRTIHQGFEADGVGEKIPMPSELADREWRADPTDGLRPLKSKRLSLKV